MNERIVELAKVAGFRSDVTVSDRHGNYIVTTTGERLEKFAELVVRECAEVASDYDGAHYVGTEIEKHFGVKK